MSGTHTGRSYSIWLLAAAVLVAGSGCHTVATRHQQGAGVAQTGATPKELCKVVLPQYTIEPPDVLMIEAVRVVPKSPYPLRTGDLLAIQVEGMPEELRPGDVLAIDVTGALSEAPITNAYPIGPSGAVDLGPPYGSVKVAGMTIEEAGKAIDAHLRQILTAPEVSVTLAQSGALPLSGIHPVQMGGMVNLGLPFGTVNVGGMTIDEAQQVIGRRISEFINEPRVLVTLAEPAGKQLVAGEHLVTIDGTVNLGTYGSVPVVGLTVDQAKMAIEHHLSLSLEDPEVAVSVVGFNSKVYYVVMQGAGFGDRVFRFPVTGNETILDAISQPELSGLQEFSSKRIWVARPTTDPYRDQILPVDWDAIVAQGATNTNYQLFPGDRLYVAEDDVIALDTAIAKITAPWERVMGFALLGAGTATRFSGSVLRGGGNQRGTF